MDIQLDEFIQKGGDRVTSVLAPYNGYAKVKPSVLEKARQRGERVHDWIRDYIRRIGSWEDLRGIEKYLESFTIFWEEKKPETILLEKRFYDYEDMLTGQIDYLGVIDGKNVLVDWKTTSTMNQTYKMQAFAYADLLIKHEYQVDAVWFVQLASDGSCPVVHEVFPHKHRAEFRECLSVYRKYFKHLMLPIFED